MACKKNEDENEKEKYLFEGYLYEDCNKEPISNKELFFYEKKYRNFGSNQENFLGSTTTDAVGYYRFESAVCPSNNGSDFLQVKDANGELIFEDECRPGGKKNTRYLPVRERCRSAISKGILKILTEKSFTTNDTLIIGNFWNNQPPLQLIGPFYTGQIIETDWLEVPFKGGGYIGHIIGLTYETGYYWGLGSQEFKSVNHPDSLFTRHVIQNVSQIRCGFGDTVLIDLRGK
jgi:hypothetical protein